MINQEHRAVGVGALCASGLAEKDATENTRPICLGERSPSLLDLD